MKREIGLNGFGRIGRLVLRRLIETNSDVEVVAINELISTKMMAQLFMFDTSYGRFKGDVSYTEDSVVINGHSIKVYSEKEAVHIPWSNHDIEVVVECTGLYTSKEKASSHIVAGAKKVLISAPAGDMKTVVYNVNDEILDSSDTIISASSCTTNCLALMAKPLNDTFGIKGGTMTTIHAFTVSQSLVDAAKGKDLRSSRASSCNIIPHSTGAAKAIGLVIPELKGKLTGHAQRVPVLTGSVTELVCILDKEVSIENIHDVMKASAQENDSLDYNDFDIVSSDIIASPYGSIFDATQTEIIELGDTQLVKVVAWYDNEYGFAAQLVRILNKYISL